MSSAKAMRPSEISERVGEYLKAGDLEGIVSMFHPECLIFFPPGQPPKRGLAGAHEAFAPLVETRPTLVSQVLGEAINGDSALLRAKWHLEDAQGEVIASGHSTEVAKQLSDGSWVYFLDCPDGPPTLESVG